MFYITEKSEEITFEFLSRSYNNGNTETCKFVKQFWEWILKTCNNKKWYVIDNESKGNYPGNTGNNPPFPSPPPQRKKQLAAVTQVAFKNCTSFKDCRTEINDTFVDYADFINITMPM